LLDSIVNDLEYDFTLLFSEDPDNPSIKEIKAKFNNCIHNIDLYGYDKEKNLDLYDNQSEKEKGLENQNDACEEDEVQTFDHDCCNSVLGNYEKGECSHAIGESDEEIVIDVEKDDNIGFNTFEVPFLESDDTDRFDCMQMMNNELDKLFNKYHIKESTGGLNDFQFCAVPEILKEAEKKICKKVTFCKNIDVNILPTQGFFEEDEKKMIKVEVFEKKVKPLACFSSPVVVSSSFHQHSLFEAPSFSLGPEFETNAETEDVKPVIKETTIRQNPRRDVGVGVNSRSPFKFRQILPNVDLKLGEERVADTLFMMLEQTSQV
jgi:hypothetical protein